MVFIWIRVLYELYVCLLQGPGEEHGMLVVNIVICHSMVQHPCLVPQILNPKTR